MAWITIAIGAASLIERNFFREKHPEVPVHGELAGEFSFTDQSGQRFSTSSMTGSVWLVSFFFTSCDGPCPLLNAQIAGIMAKTPDLKALSITTDPETDTIDVLRDYSQKFKADPNRWIFARTDEDNMVKFGQDILKLPVGEEPDAHSPRIVLIDKKGQIRGWYDSQEPNVRDVILRDLSDL